MLRNEAIENNKTELVIYESQDGNIKLDVNLENETVWLSLEQMTRLFGRDKYVRVKKYYIDKFWIYMRQPLIIILKQKKQLSSLK